MLRYRQLVVVALPVLTALAPVGAQAPVTTLAIAGRNNDGVSLAAEDRFVVATWGASTSAGMDVYSAVSRDGGATFGSPVRVNATPFDARGNGEQPPRVVFVPRAGREPSIVAVWLGRRPEGTRLLTARSDDGGASWSATSVVPGSDGAGSRGWHSITTDASGRVFALWLDHRGLATPTHQHGAVAGGPAAPKPDPVEQAGKSQVYIAALDGSVAPRAITNSVCYCCKTSFTTGADGAMYGVWRHVYPGDVRDMALTVSRDGGRTFATPVRVSEDKWVYEGCPDNGPSLAVDATKRVHVAWPSPADGKDPATMTLWYATSQDGRRFTPRVRLPATGAAGHVQVVNAGTGQLLAWEEATAAGRLVRLARATTDAAGRTTFRPIGEGEAGKYPFLSTTSTGTLLAYTQGAAPNTSIAIRLLPR